METCSFSLRVGLPLYKRRLPGVSVRIFIGVMRPLWYADKADRDLETRERFQELPPTKVLQRLRPTPPLTQAVSPVLKEGVCDEGQRHKGPASVSQAQLPLELSTF